MYPARYWKKIEKEIVCQLCPRSCKIKEGESGHCFVRKNIDSKLILTTYGKCHGLTIDPVEKKPLYHFYPGSKVLSFGTIGCNLTCQFCQNWKMSQIYDEFDHLVDASPEYIAQYAQNSNSISVAFTYNDPVIFMEYCIDTAIQCHKKGIKTIAVSAGYMNKKPAREFFNHIDAANIDLKAFSDEFYVKYTDSHIKPVLKLLAYIANNTNVWLEVTTLIIPGYNDKKVELTNLARWVKNELGNHVPLHFSAFYPANHFAQAAPTPLMTLEIARELALKESLKFVYIGNTNQNISTYCPECKAELIERNGFSASKILLGANGRCTRCNYILPGFFN
ncbi:MAG: AmmeMemoRadiSam system radical SAM enzyme [Spirochaetia bacterium]|nr:AmmeMemoRadiSam system radical SAM enzyme [Spirochaetia bacterium]